MQSTTTAGTSYALGVIVARSDLNYPKIDQLRRFGRRLPYRRLDRHRIGYLRAEVGLIPLTKAQFDDLAGSGISFRIYGRRGPYDAAVPGRIFENIGASGDE